VRGVDAGTDRVFFVALYWAQLQKPLRLEEMVTENSFANVPDE